MLTTLPFNARVVGSGTASGTITTFTIRNVTVSYGESLIVVYGTKAGGSVNPPAGAGAVVWGSTSSHEAGNASVVDGNGLCLPYYFARQSGMGTADLSVTFPGPTKPTEIVGIAIAVSGLVDGTAQESIGYSGSTGSVAPVEVTTIAAPSRVPNLLLIPHVTMGPEADNAGFWDMQTDRAMRLGGSTVTLDLALREQWAAMTVTVRKTDFTDRNWAAPITTLNGTAGRAFAVQSSYHSSRR